MLIKRLILIVCLASVPNGVLNLSAMAQADLVYTGRFSNTALGGYDPVAYFKQNEPVKGASDISTLYKGAEFHFATEENLETFLAEPETYAPQYGGYCAYAVALGKTAKGNPKNWAIVDGKLYLNLNAAIQDKWDTDRSGYISSADREWPGLIQGARAHQP